MNRNYGLLYDNIILPRLEDQLDRAVTLFGDGLAKSCLEKSMFSPYFDERMLIDCITGRRGRCITVCVPQINSICSISTYECADGYDEITSINIDHSLGDIPRENRTYFEDSVILLEMIMNNTTGMNFYIFKHSGKWYATIDNVLYSMPGRSDEGEKLSVYFNDDVIEIEGTPCQKIDGMRVERTKNRGTPKSSW